MAALGAVVGCWWAPPVPLGLMAVAGCAAAVAARRLVRAAPAGSPAARVVLAMACVAAFGGWAARARSGLHDAPARQLSGWVELADDPRPVGAAIVATVRWEGRRFDAWAFGTPGARLARRSAGELVQVTGRITPGAPGWLQVRHVVGHLDLERVGDWRPGARWSVAVNRLRAVVADGLAAAHAPPLAAGLVIGDDRHVPDDQRDRFRDSGLAHLTAVSGQNVALLTGLCAPLLATAPRRMRLAAVVTMIVTFAAVTRFEPSILRAGAMGVVVAVARHRGATSAPPWTLPAALVAVLALDPLLVGSVGFALSATATVGIMVLSAPIRRWLRGPGWFTETLAVSLAAQVGVLPVSVAVFGQVPLVAPLANLAAGPVAAGVMAWGMAVGPLAGAVPALAALVHAPTRLGTWWVAVVADRAAGLGPVWVVVAQVAVAAAVVRRPPVPPDR